jgi:hypothetical protein
MNKLKDIPQGIGPAIKLSVFSISVQSILETAHHARLAHR